METQKADNYIERLSNLQDKCYTRIVATKAVEIALEEVKDKLISIVEGDYNFLELKERINDLINK